MKKFLFLIALVFATNNLFAETGKELLDACAKAMKHEKFKEFNTSKIEASVTQMGMNIGLMLYIKDKNLRLEQSLMGQEMVLVATAEGTAFMLKPNRQEIPSEQSQQVRGQISMFMPNVLELQEDVSPENIELVGTEDFNGKSAKKVKITEESGEFFVFIDPITNWLVGISMPMFDLAFDSMKKVKGLVYPSNTKVMQGGQVAAEYNIDKWEVNIDIPDSLFAKE